MTLNAGPVHLTFDGGRGLLLDGRSDWTLLVSDTAVGDAGLFSSHDYEYEGGRWVARDASTEDPFAQALGRRLVDWTPLFNEVNEMVGVRLDLGGHLLALRIWEGEATT